MDDTTGAAPDNAPHDPTPQPSSSSSSSAPPPMAEHNPPASSRELAELRSDHGGTLEAHSKTIARLEGTVELLLEIVDSVVRHKGQVHNAAHLDALGLMLEDSDKRNPKGRADAFAAAREEMGRRTAEANKR